MEIKNCKICKKLFNVWGNQKICPYCANKLEEKFSKVKEFIRENKNCTILDVAEAMNVPAQQIKQWVREERLMFSEDSFGGIECDYCGTIIKTGIYCAKCKIELLNALRPEIKIIQPQKEHKNINNRMRFLNKNDFS